MVCSNMMNRPIAHKFPKKIDEAHHLVVFVDVFAKTEQGYVLEVIARPYTRQMFLDESAVFVVWTILEPGEFGGLFAGFHSYARP